MKVKLLTKFILSLTILGAVLAISISVFGYFNSKAYLENMYAERVTNECRTIAKMISVEDVRNVLAENGDQSASYEKLCALLNTRKEDSQITFLSLTVPDEDSVTFYIDTCVESMGDDPANQIPYGVDILYTDAASSEEDLQIYYTVWDLYAENDGTNTPLVTDNSYGYNYTAAWPVLDENGNAIAEIQYILDVQEVRDYLNSFLYKMFAISFGVMMVAILCYILFVRKTVTTPIEKLARFTEDITANGNFHKQSISLATKDEIEDLGNSFNFMLEELDNYIVNLANITAEKERIGAELSVATHIQASMLPCIFPAFPDREEFDIYATMTPAKEVGGDFYDFFLVDDNHLAVVIADVSGKGVPAALFMVIAKTLIKDHTQAGNSPDAAFTEVNQQLCESNEEGMFVTAWMGVLEISTGHMVFVNAGHNPPLVYQKDSGFTYLRTRPGFVLAGMEGMRYKAGELQLNPGDMLYLYTDGVTEATDAQETLYGEERLEKILNANSAKTPEEILAAVKEDIDVFVGEAPQFDDITMLGLRVREAVAEI